MIEFRNPDLYQLDQLRELLRGNKHHPMPTGRAGLVIEDLDLVIRWFGKQFGLDDIGRYRLVEVKYQGAPIGISKLKTIGLLHAQLQKDERYDGWYILRTSDTKHDERTTYQIGSALNGVKVDSQGLCAWIQMPQSPYPGMP